METYHHASVIKLVGAVLILQDDIADMQRYLSNSVKGIDTVALPLGKIGKILSQQLEREGAVLAADAEELQTHYVHGWELAKHSAALQKKVLLLMTMSCIIAKLPPLNAAAAATADSLAQRVIDQCHRVQSAIDSITAAAAVVSHPNISLIQ